MKELQEINKDHVHKEMEFQAGRLLPRPGNAIQKGDAKEWRSWGMMYMWEREAAFKTLQVCIGEVNVLFKSAKMTKASQERL